jgi:tellurite resistance protein TehA-like permease
LILIVFAILIVGLIVYCRFFYNRIPRLPQTGQD